MNTLTLLALTLFAPQPALPTATITGDIVTVNADIAWVESVVAGTVVKPVSIPQGTILIDSTMLASSDGNLPVAWKLLPGTYKVTAFSYPANRFIPVRTEVLLDVVIASPTRQQDIRAALQKLTEAKADVGDAKVALDVLKPTKAELRAASLP